MTSKLTYPDYGLNGSGATNLLMDAQDAAQKLREAIGALRSMTPHGRDYQCYPAGSYSEARVEHAERCRRVEGVLTEIEALVLHASQQKGAY